jgi:hypothetical protein
MNSKLLEIQGIYLFMSSSIQSFRSQTWLDLDGYAMMLLKPICDMYI